MKLAKYEKRCTRAATWLSVICATVLAIAAFAVALAVMPFEAWIDDHAEFATVGWLGQIWSRDFAAALGTLLRSNDGIARASAACVAAIMATTQWVLNANVAAALGRALLAAFLGSAAGASVAYAIMIMAAPIVDTRTRVDGMTLLRDKDGRKHLRGVMLKESGKDAISSGAASRDLQISNSAPNSQRLKMSVIESSTGGLPSN